MKSSLFLSPGTMNIEYVRDSCTEVLVNLQALTWAFTWKLFFLGLFWMKIPKLHKNSFTGYASMEGIKTLKS